MLRRVLFFGGMILSFLAGGQSSDYTFDQLGTDQGLSNLVVTSIYQDSKGFMWFGTFNGLNRYDGYEMKNYFTNPKDSLSLSDNRITCIYEDTYQNLWIGTNVGGLNLYNREKDTFTRFVNKPDTRFRISSNRIETIFQDSHGNLWVGTTDGLNIFNYQDFTFKSFFRDDTDPTSLSSNQVYSLIEYSPNEVWVVTNGYQVNRYDTRSGDFSRFSLGVALNKARFSFSDSDHNVWIGTFNDGLLKWNTNGVKQYHHAPDNPKSLSHDLVKTILQDENGQIWIGTDGGGLSIYNNRTNDFTQIKSNENNPAGLNTNAIYTLYEDNSGIIWIGTFGGGVNIYNPHKAKFLHYTNRPNNSKSLSHKSVLSMLQDSHGNIWIGTDGGGLNRFNRKTNTFDHFRFNPNDPYSISSDIVKTIYEDRRGDLWIGTYLGGLNRFDPATGKFYRIRPAPDDPAASATSIIWSIYEDSRGTMWLSTLGSGLCTYDRDKKSFHHFRPFAGEGAIGDYNIFSIYEDKLGIVWMLTEDRGINLYDHETGKFSYVRHDPKDSTSLSNDHTWAIFEDSKSNLWIGTAGGLNRYNRRTKSFDRITVRDGLPSDIVTNIIEDNSGKLWITTSKGLTRYDPEKRTYKNYDVKDGLQSNDFNINASLVSAAGELYLGGLNGFNVFKPNELESNTFVPPVRVTDFQIFNKPVPVGEDAILQKQITETDKVTISYKESVISFKFAALNYTSAEKNQYAYKMEGFEEDWNHSGTRREVTYTNLDPGTYTFRVKASNNDGVWNDMGTSLQLVITPPWWGTWWFRTGLSVFLMLAAATVYKARTRWIRETMRREKMQELALKEAQMREERLEHEKAVIELNNDKLESEVRFKNAELASSVMNVVKQNETLLKIKDDISQTIRNEKQDELVKNLKRVTRLIDSEVKPDQHWTQFEQLFNQIHENFLQKLKDRFPDLTSRDLKLCAYLRMNLNSKEIAPLLSLSVRGVEDLRYRVRKKMGLDTTVNLATFILSLP